MPLQKVAALSTLQQQLRIPDKIASPHCPLCASSSPSIPMHASAPAGNGSVRSLPAQDWVTGQALLEAVACSRAWQQQQRLHCVMRLPAMIMPVTVPPSVGTAATQTIATQTMATQTMANQTMATQTSFDGGPDAGAVLEATARSRIWQQHQMPQLTSPQDLQIELPQQLCMPSICQPDCAILKPPDAVLGTAGHVPQAMPASGWPSMKSVQHHELLHLQKSDMSRPDCSCNIELANSTNQQPCALSQAPQGATILCDGCMAKVIHSCPQQLHVNATVNVVVPDGDSSCQVETCLPKKPALSQHGVTSAAAAYDASLAVMKRIAANATMCGCAR